MNDHIKGHLRGEISTGLRRKTASLVSLWRFLTPLDVRPVRASEAFAVVRNQLLTLLKTLGQLGLRWELAHVAVFVEQIEDFAYQTVGVGRQRWNGEVFFLGLGGVDC